MKFEIGNTKMPGMNIAYLQPNAEGSGRLTPGVVCPNCYSPLTDFALYGPGRLPDGTLRRGYLGYCVRCATDCEVEQFAAFGVWPMSGWRVNRGEWNVVQTPVPSPEVATPAVVTGQGDYSKGYTPKTSDVLKKTQGVLLQVLEVLKEAICLTKLDERKH